MPVNTDLRFTAIDTWGNHTCGLTAAGAAWCWGENRWWQLGAETPADHSLLPVQVTGDITFASIVTAAYHSCGLTPEGAAWCWGDNGGGELGNGQVGGRSYTPVAVSGGYTFSVLRAGGAVTCGITPQSRAYCWGANTFGEVGDGSDHTVWERTVPTEVLGQQ